MKPEESLRLWSIEVFKSPDGRLTFWRTPNVARPMPFFSDDTRLLARFYDKKDTVYVYANYDAHRGFLKAVARNMLEACTDADRKCAERQRFSF